MTITRRDFFKALPLLPLVGTGTADSASLSESEQLYRILYRTPGLRWFKAKNGFRATVWLNGILHDDVTEIVCHPAPGKEVKGAIKVLVLENDELLEHWYVGHVKWQPPHGRQ